MPEIIPDLENYLYHYKAYVYEVTDADTVKVNWDLGRRTAAQDEILRFSVINAIEIRNPGGKEAKKFVEDRILHKDVIIKTEQDKKGRDAYGGFNRFLAMIYYKDERGWVNLNEELLEKGYAVIYE